VNVKGQDIRSFLNNIYLALGQAKLELLKNHELARGYLFKTRRAEHHVLTRG